MDLAADRSEQPRVEPEVGRIERRERSDRGVPELGGQRRENSGGVRPLERGEQERHRCRRFPGGEQCNVVRVLDVGCASGRRAVERIVAVYEHRVAAVAKLLHRDSNATDRLVQAPKAGFEAGERLGAGSAFARVADRAAATAETGDDRELENLRAELTGGRAEPGDGDSTGAQIDRLFPERRQRERLAVQDQWEARERDPPGGNAQFAVDRQIVRPLAEEPASRDRPHLAVPEFRAQPVDDRLDREVGDREVDEGALAFDPDSARSEDDHLGRRHDLRVTCLRLDRRDRRRDLDGVPPPVAYRRDELVHDRVQRDRIELGEGTRRRRERERLRRLAERGVREERGE